MHRSAAHIRAGHRAALGDRVGPIYTTLYNEVACLHVKWRQYEQLFGASESRVELLNRCAPLAWSVLQQALWNDTLLHLCRLTDPIGQPDRQRLSLRLFSEHLTQEPLKARFAQALDLAIERTAFARDHRNRRIAHSDAQLGLTDNATPLTGASRELVNEALASLATALNIVEEVVFGSQTAFAFGGELGGANNPLHVIRDGLEAEDARRARLSAGTFTEDDIHAEQPGT